MKNEKLLIIDKHQFGYLTDSFKWAEYLRNKYEVTVICINANHKKISLENVNVRYVKCDSNYILRGIIFVIYIIKKLFLFKGKVIVVYFESCGIIKKLYKKKKILLDIRTLSVSKSKEKRLKYNDKLRNTCFLFDHVSVISNGVRDNLRINKENCSILPLGADKISLKQKEYSKTMKLLYVGTLSGRKIEDTITGLLIFIKNQPDVKISYDIIGDGYNDELPYLNQLIKNYKLENYVRLHGRIPYNEITPYFDECNIGVSYIPITEYFDMQPPTKTYEYILSGLYTIATNTYANRAIITDNNGTIIDSTPEAFAKSLNYIYKNKSNFDFNKITKTLENNTWDKIVSNYLMPILDKI